MSSNLSQYINQKQIQGLSIAAAIKLQNYVRARQQIIFPHNAALYDTIAFRQTRLLYSYHTQLFVFYIVFLLYFIFNFGNQVCLTFFSLMIPVTIALY